MSLSYLQAANILNAYFRDAWVGNGRDQDLIAWDDKRFDISKVATEEYWVRHNFTELDSFQATLAGETGTKRFERACLLTVQVFTQKNAGLQLARTLIDEIANVYEGKQTQGIWFRNVRPNPVGTEGQWYQYNVLIDVIFDQIK